MCHVINITLFTRTKDLLTRLRLRSLIKPEVTFQMVGTDPALFVFRFPLHGLHTGKTISFEMQRAYPKRTGRVEVFSMLKDKSFPLRADVTA